MLQSELSTQELPISVSAQLHENLVNSIPPLQLLCEEMDEKEYCMSISEITQ